MWHILEEQIRKWKDQELLIAAPIIRPDYRTIGSNKVGRVIVGHQAVTFGGIRAEVSNQINEWYFSCQHTSVVRLWSGKGTIFFVPEFIHISIERLTRFAFYSFSVIYLSLFPLRRLVVTNEFRLLRPKEVNRVLDCFEDETGNSNIGSPPICSIENFVVCISNLNLNSTFVEHLFECV